MITPVESVVCARIDDEAVLLEVDTGIYYGLNAVGARIWELIGQGVAESEILRALVDTYEAEPAQLRADLITFVESLAEKGLVRVVSG